MRRKTSTFAALVLSAALTSTATPAAELSQAVDTTQEIPMEAEEPVLTDSTELSTEVRTRLALLKVKPKAKHFP